MKMLILLFNLFFAGATVIVIVAGILRALYRKIVNLKEVTRG